MAGAGLINMQPYTWTPAAKLAVEANRNEVAAASAMDKNRNAGQKKKGIGSSIGGMVGGIAGSYFGPVGSMVGSTLGGMIGGAIDGGGSGAASGAGEGLGMGMAMASTGAADSMQRGMKDFFGNAGLSTATDTAGTALKGAGADGNWSIGAFGNSKSGQDVNDTMSKITANSLGISPNSGLQFRGMSPGSMTLPMFGGAR